MSSTLPKQGTVASFEFARGAHVGIVDPANGFESRITITWDEFVNLITTFTISEDKVGAYVCRPMGGNGMRSDENALPWPLLPLDLDELLPEDMPVLEDWCETQDLDLVLSTTFSHTPENPRFRVWVRASRAFDANEHKCLFSAFTQTTVFPFKLDPATAKPSQPIYLPRCPSAREDYKFAKYFPGKLLDVDKVLAGFQRQLDDLKSRNKGGIFPIKGIGVRSPAGVADCFNNNYNLRALLEAHGYKRRTKNRYVAPHSKSGRAAVVLLSEYELISYHEPSHDALAERNELAQAKIVDTFGAYCHLEHANDFKSAWREAAKIVDVKKWQPSEEVAAENEALHGYVFKTADRAYRDLVPREMIVENLLECKVSVIATGASNSGKTTVLQHMSVCIALGAMFGPHQCVKGNVLWIAGEDAYNAQLRFGVIAERMGIDLAQLGDSLIVLAQPISVLDRASMSAFHSSIDKQLRPDQRFSLVVLDSKSVNWGGEDENSNDENASFVKELTDHFTTRYEASTVTTHHPTKNKEKEEQTARGASALINNMDHEWRFERSAQTNICTMEPGSKLRIARWQPLKFAIEIVEAKAPWLRNSQGRMPTISIAELTHQYGVSAKQQKEDKELADVLGVLISNPNINRKQLNDTVARALGVIQEGMPKANLEKGRDWVRARLAKLKQQLHLTEHNEVTDAGRKWYDLYVQAQALSESAQSKNSASDEPDA